MRDYWCELLSTSRAEHLDAAFMVTCVVLVSSDLKSQIWGTMNGGAAKGLLADITYILYRVLRLIMDSDSLYRACKAGPACLQGFHSRVSWALESRPEDEQISREG